MKAPAGTIALFYGVVGAIPPGWLSCDGTGGTPDLRDRFVRGAGVVLAPHLSGGSAIHNHDFASDGHFHTLPAAGPIGVGATFAAQTDIDIFNDTTSNTTSLPPYHALIWVQKT